MHAAQLRDNQNDDDDDNDDGGLNHYDHNNDDGVNFYNHNNDNDDGGNHGIIITITIVKIIIL